MPRAKKPKPVPVPVPPRNTDELLDSTYILLTDRLAHLGHAKDDEVKGKDLEELNIGFLIKANQLKAKE